MEDMTGREEGLGFRMKWDGFICGPRLKVRSLGGHLGEGDQTCG